VKILKYLYRTALLAACIVLLNSGQPSAETVTLTAESAVSIAIENGYRFKMLELARKRNLSYLKAERASLKSRVYMNLRAPEYSAVSDYKWNSTLYMNEIIRTNTRRWQMDISLRQPVIILGYPTNGYLSLNNRTYKYIQKEDFGNDVDYYNRFFIEFEQPFFTTNELKNDIEEAELDLKMNEMEDASDKVNEIIGVSFSFNNLLEVVLRDSILSGYIRDLENMLKEVNAAANGESSQSIEGVQAALELKNAHEMHMNNLKQLRGQSMNLKQRIRLNIEDSLVVKHDIRILPIDVDLDQALELGYSLSPRLRRMRLGNRKTEIDLDNEKSEDAFRLNLETSLGFENNNDVYREMWDDYTNSYSVSLFAYFPIWDWGRRKANIEAAEISLKRAHLYLNQVRDQITNSIVNSVANLNDYKARVLLIEKSLVDARESYEASVTRYREGKLSMQGVLKAMERKKSLEFNYLEAYIGYRGSILRLSSQTFFHYEHEMSMYDCYDL